MNAFFEFLKWFIKLLLATCAIVFAVVFAFILGVKSKRRARREVAND